MEFPGTHSNGDQEEGASKSDNFGRFECGKNVADEPVRQQEVHQPVQGDNRCRFPDQRSDGRRSDRHYAGKTVTQLFQPSSVILCVGRG